MKARSVREVDEYCAVLEDFFQEAGLEVIKQEAKETVDLEGDFSCMLSLYEGNTSGWGGKHVARVYVGRDRVSVTGRLRVKIAKMLDRRLAGKGFEDLVMWRVSKS